MSTFLSNPTHDQMYVRIVGPNKEQDGVHVQPHAQNLELPAGFGVHQNSLVQHPKLIVTNR